MFVLLHLSWLVFLKAAVALFFVFYAFCPRWKRVHQICAPPPPLHVAAVCSELSMCDNRHYDLLTLLISWMWNWTVWNRQSEAATGSHREVGWPAALRCQWQRPPRLHMRWQEKKKKRDCVVTWVQSFWLVSISSWTLVIFFIGEIIVTFMLENRSFNEKGCLYVYIWMLKGIFLDIKGRSLTFFLKFKLIVCY